MSRAVSALQPLRVPLQRSSLFRTRVRPLMAVFVLSRQEAGLVAEHKVPAEHCRVVEITLHIYESLPSGTPPNNKFFRRTFFKRNTKHQPEEKIAFSKTP